MTETQALIYKYERDEWFSSNRRRLFWAKDCGIARGKAGEAHLIHKAKTIEPLGMNKRDEL